MKGLIKVYWNFLLVAVDRDKFVYFYNCLRRFF